MRLLSTLALLACGAAFASGALTLPPAISSHMVLQRNGASVVWGWSDQLGGDVQVTLNGQEAHSVQVQQDGAWSVDLGKHAASTGNTLVISDSKSTALLVDVAFGDVILCSGQSNMAFGVPGVNNAAAEIADSANYPQLRMFTVAANTSLTPLATLGAVGANWQVSGPAAFPQPTNAWGLFSATCYFTGRELYKSLGGLVPIGLVASFWGGTPVEAWSSPDALAKCPSSAAAVGAESALSAAATDVEAAVRSAGSLEQLLDGPSPNTPSVLYNAMIHPLLPMRFAFALWYQGEANAGNPTSYACRFPAMIADWRAKLALPLPFFFVQLAAYPEGGSNWPLQQIAQTAALQLSQVGMATAMDLGDPSSPEGDIHPRSKQTVGERLFRTVSAMLYGAQSTVFTGPLPAGASLVQGQSSQVLLHITGSPASAGLHFNGTDFCTQCCSQMPFTAVTAKGAALSATRGAVSGVNTVVLDFGGLAAGDSIASIGYAMSPYPQCALYNDQGLPMTVFSALPVQANRQRRGARVALQ